MLNSHLIARTAPAALPENRILWKNIRMTLLTDRLIRLEQTELSSEAGAEECFLDEATQAVWFRDLPAVPHTCERGPECCILETAALKLEVRGRCLPAGGGGHG